MMKKRKMVLGFILIVMLVSVLNGCSMKRVYIDVKGIEILNEPYKSTYDNKTYSNYYGVVTYVDDTTDEMAMTWKGESDEWYVEVIRTDNKQKYDKLLVNATMTEDGEVTKLDKNSSTLYVSDEKLQQLVEDVQAKGYIDEKGKRIIMKQGRLSIQNHFKNIEGEDDYDF